MTIGDNIRKLRKERGLTQKELGKLCGINEAQIRRYELGGNNSTPKIETLQKIANALRVEIRELDGRMLYIPEGYFDFYRDDFTGERTPEQEDLYISNKIMGYMNQLNKTGQEKAFEQVELLTKIPEYRKDAE